MKIDMLSSFLHSDDNEPIITVLDENRNHVITCPRDYVDYIDIAVYGNVGSLFVTYDEEADAYVLV